MWFAPNVAMRSILILITFIGLLATGCATKAGTGTAVGAGAGGLIGGLAGGTTGALIGVVAGGALGYVVGNQMDQEDRRRAAYALEQNREMEWRNAQGEQYRVVPTRTTYQHGRECRSYRIYAEIDGRPDTVDGVACRRPDGSWEQMQG